MARFASEEYAALEAYLGRREMPVAVLDMGTLEGYLTGLAAAPVTPSAGRWLPRIWGRCRHSPAAVPLRSTAEVREFRLLVAAFLAQVRGHLERATPTYVPIFYRWPVAAQLPDPWCLGFRLALRIDRTAWRPLQSTHGELLCFSEMYGTLRGVREIERAPREERRSLAEMAGDSIPRIVQFWRGYRPGPRLRVPEVRHENPRLSCVAPDRERPDFPTARTATIRTDAEQAHLDAGFRREMQGMVEQLQWFLDRRFPLHPNTRAEALQLLERAGPQAAPRARTEDLLESFLAVLEQRKQG